MVIEPDLRLEEGLPVDLDVRVNEEIQRALLLGRGERPAGAADLLRANRLVPLTPRVKELADSLSAGTYDKDGRILGRRRERLKSGAKESETPR